MRHDIHPASSSTRYPAHRSVSGPGRFLLLLCLAWAPALSLPGQSLPSLKIPRFGLHLVDKEEGLAAKCGADARRCFVSWNQLEPQQGTYDYSFLDRAVEASHRHGNLNVVVTLQPVSQWDGNIVTGPGGLPGGALPRNLAAWIECVRRTAERYDGDGIDDQPDLRHPVSYWQVGNEFYQWQDSVDNYLTLLEQTRKAILSAHPSAKVILIAITGSELMALEAGLTPDPLDYADVDGVKKKVYRQELQTGNEYARYRKNRDRSRDLLQRAGTGFDIADFHSYTIASDLVPAQLRWMRDQIGYRKPVWSLECGGPMADYTPAEQSRQVVKRYVLGFASGVGAIFWGSLLTLPQWPQTFLDTALMRRGLFFAAWKPKPAYHTYRLLTQKLARRPAVQDESPGPDCRLFRFHGNFGTCRIAWSETPGGYRLHLPVEGPSVRLTRIVELPGQVNPASVELPVVFGRVVIDLTSSPVFLE